MQKFTLYLGLSDRITKQQKCTTEQAKSFINQIVGDCTISECIGFYTDLDNKTISETTLKIELLDFTNNLDINKIINDLGLLFNQESIAFETSIVNSRLI